MISFAILILCSTLVSNSVLVIADETTESKPIQCGKNEEYATCIPCQRTCENPISEFCTQGPCVKGCKCKLGYFRDSKNKCVSVLGCIIDKIQNQNE